MVSSSPMDTYIYCIARAAPLLSEQTRFLSEAVGGSEHPTRIVSSGDLAAVVSDVPAGRLQVKRELLMAHEAVVVEAMEHSDVIPLSFGVIAKNDEDVVERLLRSAASDLHQQLDAVSGCVELAVQAIWKRERLFEEIVAEDDRVRTLQGAVANAPLNEQIELGKLASEIIAVKSDREAQVILDRLEPLAVGVRLNRQLTDMMALNAAFLVERSGLEAFDTRVGELAEAAKDRLIVRYIGPVPPYHFINLSLGWEDESDGPTD